MTWFKVDDNLAFHRKVVTSGNAAMGLWVRAGSWSAQHLTDGFVPDSVITLLGTHAQAKRLVRAGLWVEVAGGCQFHEWNENGRQPTAQSVREDRKKSAERQAKWRAKNSGDPQVSGPGDDVTDALVTPLVTPFVTGAPTRPDPYTPTDVGVAPQQRRRATRIPDDFSITTELVAWVGKTCPDVNGRRETERFINYWSAKAGREATKLDWVKTWKNWMLEEQKRFEQRPGRLRAVSGEGRPAWLPSKYDDDGVMRDPKTGVAIER